jgi:hypothetical protein
MRRIPGGENLRPFRPLFWQSGIHRYMFRKRMITEHDRARPRSIDNLMVLDCSCLEMAAMR